jgi:uncharacterized membrane protein YedE/YeeE
VSSYIEVTSALRLLNVRNTQNTNHLYASNLPIAKFNNMSGFEVVGLVLAVVPIAISAFEHLSDDANDFGIFPAIVLRLGLFEAKDVVDQVREHFIKGDGGLDQAMAFKDSYTPTFNMVGVAGAIIAQIALTALSLPNLDDTHWTARAAFTIGLVAGSLAVFCSCVLQSKMSSLHSPYAVRRWLTRPHETFADLYKPRRAMNSSRKGASDPEIPVFRRDDPDGRAKLLVVQENLVHLREQLNKLHSRPSLSAALIITAPSQLLNVALGALLTGFGIYFGLVYTARLPAIEDHSSALAVLTVYIVSAASGLVLFYLPMLFKLVATMRDGKRGGLEEEVTSLEKLINAAQQQGVLSKPDDTLAALNEIIRIQGEQLQLQKDLVAALQTRVGVAAGSPTT